MAAFENAKKAGLKIKTVSKTVREQNQSESVYTEHFQDGFERSEQSIFLPERTVYFVHVRDLVHARLLSWRSDRPEYRVIKTEEPPTEPEPLVGDPELIIDSQTTDTGERKTFFGQPTRHLIMEETRRWVGAERRGSDAKTILDGWYVEAEALPASKQRSVGCVLYVGRERPRIQVNHTGPLPSGVAMYGKQVLLHERADGSTFVTSETMTQVVEWVERPLPDELFRPPEGYTRVTSFTNHEPMRE